MIVAFAPGGATDVLARLLAQKLGERWAHPMVVENRGGGGTVIATELVVKADPDGHTLLFTSAALVINPSLRKSLPYDTVNDLTPVTLATASPSLLVVNPSVPAKDMKELLALAKAKPGTLSFGSSGIGASNHLAGELVKIKAGVDMIHVPFKGTGDAMAALLGGQITMMFDSMVSGLTQVRAGSLRPIGVTSARRVPSVSEIPAIAETIPGFEVDSWLGILGPARMSNDTLAKVNAELTWALNHPDVKGKLAELGTAVVASTPDQFRAAIKTEIETWRQTITAANIPQE